MLHHKLTRKGGLLRVIISILLETSDHSEIQNRQYCKTVQTVEAILAVLSIFFFVFAVYYLMIIACALSDQCYSDWVGR